MKQIKSIFFFLILFIYLPVFIFSGVGVNSEEGNQHLLLKLSPETPDDGTEADMTNRAVRA